MPRHTDAQIIAILHKAARRLNRRLNLTGTVCEIVVSSSGTMSSPTDEQCPGSEDLEDMLLLQAECLIASREYQQDISGEMGGLLVVDGEQRLDERAQVLARGTFYDSPYGPCKELEDAIKLDQIRRLGLNGKLVW